MRLQYEQPKLEGQRSTLNLFIAIVSLGSTYQVRIMTKASTVFKKNFKKKKHLNALGSKI